ncbi:MAG: hypothetical protein J6T46_13605, partial [Victivallales bacterium]|nr:hypothetical protein [Victivallales bacterium]
TSSTARRNVFDGKNLFILSRDDWQPAVEWLDGRLLLFCFSPQQAKKQKKFFDAVTFSVFMEKYN